MDDRTADRPHALGSGQLGVVDALPIAALLLDDDYVVRHANPVALDLLRVRPGEPVLPALFDEPEPGAADEVLSHTRQHGRWEGLLPLVGRDGSVRQATLVVDRLGADGDGLLLVVEDLGGSKARARRLAERLTRVTGVTAELLLVQDLEGVTKVVIEHLADAAGATVASLSVLVDDEHLRLLGIRGGREGVETRWQTFPVAGTPAGEAVRTREPVLLSGRDEIEARYPSLERAAEGERSILCLPLLVAGRAVGVTSLSFPGRRTLDPAELQFFRVLADTCAQALDRVRALTEAEDRASQLRFLAHATQELTRSLDYEATLAKVARLAVPTFADWCAISLGVEGELRTLAVAHVDPEKVALAEELQRRFPPEPDSGSGTYQVFRTGRSELTRYVTDEMFDAMVPDEEQRRLVKALDLRSAILVPLKVKDRVLGVVTWVTGEAGRRYTEQDLVFAEDVAGRAAVAIDNAQLHTELRQMAVRLQRAVLPAALPEIAGWELAAHYSPSGRLDAGGDFYDVIRLEDGRVVVFVGDVMGHGVHAAAAMAQMRASIRAVAAVDADPALVVAKLDRLFETYDFDQLVTMVYAVIDPAADELVLVNAGHPVPMIRDADGAVRSLPDTEDRLLGAGSVPRRDLTVPFGPGETLVMFTDGLVERRGEDIDVGLARLTEALATAPDGPAHDLLLRLVDEVGDRTREDDVAILAIRRERA
ncbi:MAG: SpoIIE family protein phosphatase [Nocardioidaceae bacterium]|nr:SpoIIE family protein phosphatase [Nocardioidaceae bacterium]NUS50423.1 SpoIIE family protein phosphatase [Nocardioidaceae bacterium]